jgi:hypothetical protein
MQNFISLFPSMLCHLKCFETANQTTPKMHDFILEFHNIIYFILFHWLPTPTCLGIKSWLLLLFIGCLWDEMKLIDPNASFMGFYFFGNVVDSFIGKMYQHRKPNREKVPT